MLKIFAIILFAAIILDVLYTSVYYHSKPRNTFQNTLSLEKQQIDYVFLGSSRVANHIDTHEVVRQTGKTAINLGMEGAWLNDNLLQLKILLAQGNIIEKVFLQVDYQYEDGDRMSTQNSIALPYIHNSVIKNHIANTSQDIFKYYYIPFYRYLKSDFKIGFREFFLSLVGKSPKTNMKSGFTPKIGTVGLNPKVLPKTIKNENKTITDFIVLCENNNIEIVFFCAPFCSKLKNKEYIDKLKVKIPTLQDYSETFSDSQFYDCSHLSKDGAILFTRKLISQNL